jgi:hypothetical protein
MKCAQNLDQYTTRTGTAKASREENSLNVLRHKENVTQPLQAHGDWNLIYPLNFQKLVMFRTSLDSSAMSYDCVPFLGPQAVLVIREGCISENRRINRKRVKRKPHRTLRRSRRERDWVRMARWIWETARATQLRMRGRFYRGHGYDV